VREAQEVERVGLAEATLRPALGGEPAELDEARLVGVQFQVELRESLAKVVKEPPCVTLMLEPGHEIIRETHDDHVTARVALPPLPGPPVKDVMEVDVGEERRRRSPLRCSLHGL